MIVWINGTFGAGKTTTSTLLQQKWNGSRLFDPEEVGYALGNNLRDYNVSNFQDLAPWRPLVVETIDQVARFTGQNVIAVQTVLDEDYWIEIHDGLVAKGHEVFHVVLESGQDILHARIDADQNEQQAREWRHEHVDRYVDEREWMTAAADLVVDTSAITQDEAATRIHSALESNVTRPAAEHANDHAVE